METIPVLPGVSLRSARAVSAILFCLFASLLSPSISAQRATNTNTAYQQLRGLLPGGEVITVKDFTLHRDAAEFTFRTGRFAFFGEVNGKITGVVFRGDGHLHIAPPVASERHNLMLLTKSENYDEDFDQAVLRFTDGTAAEIHKAATGKDASDPAYTRAAMELQTFARDRDHLGMNLDLRLLEDVMSPAPSAFFLAAIHSQKNPREFFVLDPHGVTWMAPEEVALLNWKSTYEEMDYPLAFHLATEYSSHTASGSEYNLPIRSLHEDLDVTIEKRGFLTSLATVKIEAEQDGVSVVPMDLYPTLRVSNVATETGESLDWVQEKKDDDPEFGVVLAKPLKKGEAVTLKVTYGGKDVVMNEGNGNYYPVARDNWFPNAGQGLGAYATYTMKFHIPKNLQLIATGTKIDETTDGKIKTSNWKTDVPLPVVGFSLGNFEMKEAKANNGAGGALTVDAYANKDISDDFSALAIKLEQNNVSLGSMSTLPMLEPELSQGQAAAGIYSDYFGQLPFDHIALTQQSACNYGQSWPMLVYLPVCGFLDSTQQHFLGLAPEDMYWKVVTPHEVAHQWWGHTVGFRSYRDQWMSEGFADASASIFLQATRNKLDDFLNFWKEERKLLTEKNQYGFRPIDVGPVTMGYRLNSPKAGYSIARNLIYPKGAYILHMVRIMMWTQQGGDKNFQATMKDLIQSHKLQAITTEDFKAAVERHMLPNMDLDKNGKMDWFFDEYVYGTELPKYHFEGQATPNDKGTLLHIKLTQSGVSDKFGMPVPVYLEFTNGRIHRVGSITINGNTTVDQSVQLPKLPADVKKVAINEYYDVLCTEN